MLKNFIKLFLLIVVASAFFAIPVDAKKTADQALGVLGQTVGQAGYDTLTKMPQTVPELAGFWIKTALSVVGIVFFIFMGKNTKYFAAWVLLRQCWKVQKIGMRNRTFSRQNLFQREFP